MINIAICDDDKEDINLIRSYITAYMNSSNILCKIREFLSGEALLEAGIIFDLVFLDIAMHKINGIHAGITLRKNNKNVKIIYISNFSEYWAQAINNVHAFAYLKKPIEIQDISRQMEEALCCLKKEEREAVTVSFEIITIRNGYITDTEWVAFKTEDIFYFQYIGRKVLLKTKEKDYIFVDQMKDVREKMEPYAFASCHQNYLVNLKHVQKIKGYHLFLKNGDKLPVSQKKSAKFREKLNHFIQHNI